MTNLVAINNQSHKNLKIDQTQIEQHGADLHMVPVVVSEFKNLTVNYPILLTKNGDTGRFTTIAMLGFDKGENLFWQDDSWQAIYVPLQIQRQPFFIGSDEQDESQYIVCLDTSSPAVSESTGENLFSENGEESEFFKAAKSKLATLLSGEKQTEQFIETLSQMNLIRSLSLDIEFENKQSKRYNGLYTIDEEKLAQLTVEQMASLHHANFLQPIYTMLASMGQIYALIDKKNKRLAG